MRNWPFVPRAMVMGPGWLDNRTVRQFCHARCYKAMPKLSSQIDTRSKDFADNRAAMQALVDDLRSTLRRNAAGGSAAARDKHTKAGKLLARERIAALLDAGSPFLELLAPAAQRVYG